MEKTVKRIDTKHSRNYFLRACSQDHDPRNIDYGQDSKFKVEAEVLEDPQDQGLSSRTTTLQIGKTQKWPAKSYNSFYLYAHHFL